MYDNKILLITGGTGSFGRTVLDRFINSELSEIRIFSRDEKKQDDLRREYNHPKLKFFIGDVRDHTALTRAVSDVSYIFHAAALKQVPSCEFFPMEAFKTNVLGTQNVVSDAIKAGVERIVCLSTDKAVYPINAMGISKAMMEKIVVAESRYTTGTRLNVTRYGNVMGSRGSVIPLFIRQIQNDEPITVTNPSMTRFMMTLEDAVDLVLFAFQYGSNGEILVRKSPATTIGLLAQALKEMLGKPDHPVITIGTRHGEKTYESLLSKEELALSVEREEYFLLPPDARDLNYNKFVEKGMTELSLGEDFNSDNTTQISLDETKQLLARVSVVKAALLGQEIHG